MAHYQSPNDITKDLSLSNSSFSSFDQYYKSKMANVIFTVGLANRLVKYTNVKTASLHPGIVDSGFGRESGYFNCFKSICCCMFVD